MGEEDNKIHSLLSDVPRIGKLSGRQKQISDCCIKLIKEYEQLKAFAIYGDWGTGKTSICRTIYEQFNITKKSKDGKYYFIPIWFEAWRFQHESDIYPALLRTISDSLIKADCSEKLNTKAKKLWNCSIRIGRSILAGSKVTVPLLGELSMQDALKDYDAQGKKDTGVIDELKAFDPGPYYEAYTILQSIPNEIKFQGKNVRILIFIDDLDRCLPDIAFRMIEQLKIWFDLNNYTVCLALKPNEIIQIVTMHLIDKLGYKEEYSRKLASQYLQKVITFGVYVNKEDFENNMRASFDPCDISSLLSKLKLTADLEIDNEEVLSALNSRPFRERINIKNELYVEHSLLKLDQ